jgi:hypothetical protein
MMTQGNTGVRYKVTTVGKRMISCSVPAERKGHSGKGPGREGAAREAAKRRMTRKNQRKHPRCNSGIWYLESKQWLHQRMSGTFGEIYSNTVGHVVA